MKANFYNTQIYECNLSNCILVKSSFSTATLNHVNFSHSDLTEASFGSSNFFEVEFYYANMTDSILQVAEIKRAHNLSVKNLIKAKDLYGLSGDSKILEKIKNTVVLK